jgi:hypothetical protein
MKSILTSSVEAALQYVLIVLVHGVLIASVAPQVLILRVNKGLCRPRDREMRRLGVGPRRRRLGVGPRGRGRRVSVGPREKWRMRG